jgi:hypothetical protein
MEVTLTPHAEELLREALARSPGRSPEEILEQVLAERIVLDVAPARVDPVWECLRSMRGVKLPDHWPPQFEKFEPLAVEGEPVSEQLIRERR